MEDCFHTPVMLDEAVGSLNPRQGGVYVDGTLGGGGHAREILRRSSPDGILVGIDRDDEALEQARQTLKVFGGRAILIKGNFRDIKEIVSRLLPGYVDGILFDLGVSSHHLETASRGFSFSKDGPLDMRMNQQDELNAFHIVNTWAEPRLKEILREFGEERFAGKIARTIVRVRKNSPVKTTGELASIVEKALGPRARREKIHPATRTFQALRICVNRELDDLPPAIEGAIDVLTPGRGRFTVISFHSLEDRIVKRLFRGSERRCVCPPDFPVCVCGRKGVVKVLTRRVVKPGPDEIGRNPRAASARLRTVEKL
ncbi:MAG: ribosomal RNA small subunit methyltransferase H [delta proteobacterium MLS_D]|jgi:16S rRNA (cytosine1402-N4)-methyltransferase|nr:MAG: ribosomal RNA small subunit methyltransferase H [delta proteobacterium MLS_D]